MYFNRKYRRVGPLFQGRYGAVRIIGARHLMAESRYIHLNPLRAGLGWEQYQFSSISAYLSPFDANPLVNTGPVLELFNVTGDYGRYLYREMRSRPKSPNNSNA
jgi:hypothetical protein